MLFVWARALVCAQLSGSDLIVSPWTKLRAGPLLRGKKHRRWYRGYFKQLHGPRRLVRWLLLTYPRIREPYFESSQRNRGSKVLYVFSRIPHWRDYFGGIRGHRDLVRAKLYQSVSDRCLEALNRVEPPIVGVHVGVVPFACFHQVSILPR